MTSLPTPPLTTPPTVAHDSTDGSAEWCDDCHGYTHMPWCPNYVDDKPQTGAASISPKIWACDNCGVEGSEECLQLHHVCGQAATTEEPYETVLRLALEHVDRSAAAIRARRAALLERADIHSPTEGAIALAEAWLSDEARYRHLPNNAIQDAAVLELAGEIENAVGSWLQGRQEEE